MRNTIIGSVPDIMHVTSDLFAPRRSANADAKESSKRATQSPSRFNGNPFRSLKHNSVRTSGRCERGNRGGRERDSRCANRGLAINLCHRERTRLDFDACHKQP